MTKTAINRPVTTVMGVLIIFLVGMIAYSSLELAYMPSVDMPMAVVSTTYSGTGPEEMEDLVTKPIEQTMATLTGVDTITSRSSTGSSMVMIEFVDGTDLDTAVNDMRDKLDRVKRQLPDDADDPTIMKMDMDATTIEVGITSDKYSSSSLYELLDNNITSQFEKIDGVASVEMMGGEDKEVRITVDPDKLNNYGITMSTISSTLASENNNTPGGSLYEGTNEIQIKVKGKFQSLEDIKNLAITTKGGNRVLLKDIATVEKVDKEKDRVSYINGKEGMIYQLSKQSDANVVTVSDNINSTIATLSQEYPDLEITMMSTTADYIKLSLNNVIHTAFETAFLAVVVLLIFLRDWKSAFVIGVSIPTSIMAAFSLMFLKDMTLNILSMSGLVVGIGMLVDDSVVVLDNIAKHYALGKSPKQAALDGTNEVGLAVFASTITKLAVFGPMLFISGTMGKMLQDFCYTICFALAASIFVALTFVPMAFTIINGKKKKDKEKKKKRGPLGKLDAVLGNALDKFDTAYGKALSFVLRHRGKTLIVVLVFFVLTLIPFKFIGMDLMSTTDEGALSISAEMPSGASFEETQTMLNKMLDCIGEIPEQKNMTANANGGTTTGSAISININLVDKEERTRSTEDVQKEVEQKLSNIAGAKITVSTGSAAMGSMGGSGYTVNIKGDDSDTLKTISDDLLEKLEEIPNSRNVESSIDNSIPEVNIVIDRAKAYQYGLTTSQVASLVSAANSGSTATQYDVDGTEIDVTIQYPDEDINYIKDLNNLTITSSTGSVIPLTQIASITMSESEVTINRENQHRYVQLTGEIEGMSSSEQQAEVTKVLDTYVFPENYSYEFGGLMDTMNETFTSLLQVLLVAIVLIYMVMASQFESFVYPFIIMFSIPIALTGGVTGLFLTGMSLTTVALLGLIMLVGMGVNNPIVLIDYVNQLRGRSGCTCDEALMMAGPSRLRPIVMTTLTTILGMVPMSLALTSGMETMQSMAITIIFGMLISSIITLFLVPVLYSCINSIKRWLDKKIVGAKIRKRDKNRERGVI